MKRYVVEALTTFAAPNHTGLRQVVGKPCRDKKKACRRLARGVLKGEIIEGTVYRLRTSTGKPPGKGKHQMGVAPVVETKAVLSMTKGGASATTPGLEALNPKKKGSKK